VFGVSLLKDIKTGAAIGLFAAFVTWIISISTKKEKPRVTALLLVFFVVIFFWMAFHQNGLTLTWFARDYTAKAVDPFTFMFFSLDNLLAVVAFLVGLVLVLSRKKSMNTRLTGAALLVAGGTAVYFLFKSNDPSNPIAPEVFQSFRQQEKLLDQTLFQILRG